MEYGKINGGNANPQVFIVCFGSPFSDIFFYQSQFVRPAGICVTTEGKIVVVEEDEGHRIQIL